MREKTHNSREVKLNTTLFKALKTYSWAFVSAKPLILIKYFNDVSIYRRLLVTLLLISGVTVGAYLVSADDAEVYNIQVINVFPSKISAPGWINAETIVQQNLNDLALYQDFNLINSASFNLEEVSIEQIIDNRKEDKSKQTTEPLSSSNQEVIIPPDETNSTEISSSSVNSGFETVESIETSPSEGDIQNTAETESVPIEETDDNTSTTTAFKKPQGTLSWVFSSVTKWLPFMNESTTTPNITGELPEPGAVEKEDIQTLPEEQSTVSTVTNSEATKETSSNSTSTIEIELTDSTASTTTSTTSPLTTPISSSSLPTLPDLNPEFPLPTDSCGDECAEYSLVLSDFGLPIFDEDFSVHGAQLKVSFAAKLKKTREVSQFFKLHYSFDDGANWSPAGEIVINEEVTNGTNGGYFLFALPEIADSEALNNLMIKMTYDDDPRALDGLFVESAWLELFTLETPDVVEDNLSLLTDNGYDSRMLKGDKLKLPDGSEVEFTFTDDNTDETLIIKSDKVTYPGLTETTLYFNVTNTSNSTDTFTLQTYFPSGTGKVDDISEWNHNKPRDVVVPEYKPFVYHCEAGWELTTNPINSNLQDISKLLAPVETIDNDANNISNEETSSLEEIVNTDTINNASSTTVIEGTVDIESETIGGSLQTDFESTIETVKNEEASSEETLKVASTSEPLLQANIANNRVSVATTTAVTSDDDELVNSYICRNTNIVRACDEIDGDNTACRVNDVKVREHKLVKYVDGWESEMVEEGEPEDKRSFLKKAKDFLGFGPDIKPKPANLEVRAHTPNQYTIAPGETKYFKMEISFPPLTTGEFWIEAIGDDEYGLLDPFWSSQWNYRMPITIDNTTGTADLTEHQVLLELGSGLTDFWNNVNPDGSDIRFVQETTTGTEDAWYGTGWSDRIPITIQASQVDSDQTDFPVYVNLADLGATFFNTVQSDGDDIRVTESDGTTEVPYELVSLSTSGDTGELHFKGDISSTVDTTFYIYFGNADATGYADTDTYGAQNVWNSSFIAVYHLEEDASGRGTVGLYQDSTSNGYDADDQLNSTGKTGLLGQGQEVSAQGVASEYILLPSNIVNGETELTFSYWMNSSEANNQALINGGANNEYLLFATVGGTSLQFFPGATIGITDISVSPTWRHVLVSRDTVADQWRAFIDGQEDNNSPSAQALSTLSIPSNCLVVGLEQDTTCLSSGDTSQHLDATIDEMRFQNIVPADDWISATFRNQSTTTDFYATSTIESFTSTVFSELDFWVQHFSTSTDEADIWVQVDSLPAGASTTIHLYYGNSGATSASNEYAPFTYSTSTPIYYVVENATAGAIDVYSYVDNNEVSIDGGAPVSLDTGETTSFGSYSSTSVISSLGPIAATIDDAGGDTLVPIAFATTTFVVPNSRNTSAYYVYSPFASSSVQSFIGNSGTADQSQSVPTSTSRTFTTDSNGVNGVVISATSPILLYHVETSDRDSMVVYPPTTRDLFGIYTGQSYVSTLVDNPDPTVYCSGGGTNTVTGVSRGERQSIGTCTSTNQGAGNAARFTNAATAIAAIQQGDGDGSESSVYWAEHEMSTRYFIPTASAYVAIACSPRFGAVTLEVQLNDGTFVEGATCTPTATDPGKVYFDNGQGGSALAYAAGYQVVSTNGVPFYAMYEDDEEDNDETNMLGAVQGRKYSNNFFGYSFGAQEVTIDAQYEQLSFGWYENTNNQTPTSTWPLGEGDFATEGVAITGQGAVNTGDVMRLRMSVEANVATGTVGSTAFKLQYTEANSGQCSVATTWSDVGEIGSTTAAFNGYNNTALVDGSTLSSTTLASSTVFATYEEENLSEFIPNVINPDEIAEWDWVITSNNASANSNYCFRMVRSTGVELITYTTYAELETAGPPLQPTLLTFFDNERTASSSPVVMDFTSTDIAGNDIRYQIQVDDDVAFGSPIIDRDSETHLSQFENINTPSDKTPFDSGARIRFTGSGSLSASTTYWWRVRGLDPDGSNTWGEWSVPYSFTTDGSVTVSEWHQTTGDQFSTNSLTSLSTSTGAVSVSGSSGTMVGTPIDFDDAIVGNAWGEFSWNDTETSGTILYQIEYLNGTSWVLVPDSVIANNSIGNGTSPINLLDMDTDTYNEIRLVANFSGTTLSIQDWTVIWGQRVETPTLGDPFDNEKIATTTPTFDFTTTDPQNDTLEYEVSWSTDISFTSSSTRNSSTSPGFMTGNPYSSGANVTYTIQSGEALTNGTTYWWRVRAKDPFGGDAWSPWSDPDAFTVDTGVSVSTWFQTTKDQFQQGTLNGLTASTSGSVSISNEVGEYGKTVLTAGTWTEISTQILYNNPVVVASVRYSMTGDAQRTVRVRNKQSDSFEIIVDDPFGTLSGTSTVDYLVMEAGTWSLQDGAGGTQVIAGTYENVSDVQGGGSYAASGYGADVTFSPAFSSAPAVIATVSSDNDSSWVIAHLNNGNTRNSPPTASAMGLYLGRSQETAVHSPEDIDYIAFEPGHGTNNGSEFDADFGSDSHDEAPPTAEAFTSAFSPSAPEVVIVMQGAEQGGNGAWASLYAATAPTTANYYPTIDESGDRNHTTEPVLALAFESSSGILLRDSTVGSDLTGEIYSEPIVFSDGVGPKFERLLWNDTETGTSTITYQIQYLTSTSSWALIPDVDLPNNSIGTTTSPIDLTGLNVVNYHTIRIVGNFACASGNCPSLQDWTVEWSEGVLMSGTAREYDRSTNVTSGTVRAAVNGTPVSNTGTISGGTWSISNVTAFAGDVITVWVDGAAEADEAVAVFVYDGVGDITGVELFEQHLSLSSNENGTTTNTLLATYDNSVSGDEDIFFDVDGLNDLTVCSLSGCSEANLYIGTGDIYIPDTSSSGNVTTHDLINNGRIELDSNTIRVSGSWDNNSTLLPETSTIILTATSTTETLDDNDNLLDFQNLTFGESSGAATWQILDPLDINGVFNVSFGTLNRGTQPITVAGNLTTGIAGFWSGVGTTTFDGSGTSFWSDNNTTKQNVGRVVVDGSAKTITLSTSVYASSTQIGVNDTLNAGGANTLFLAGNFINNNVFSAQTGTIQITGTGTNAVITTNGSSLYNLTASTSGGAVSFSESSITMLGDLTIATGTVTMTTATTSIGGSFINTGGAFAHNNGAVRFIGTGARSIQLGGTTFLNHLYNAAFSGGGTYTFIDTNATTSNNFRVSNGTVVLPGGTLVVGGLFSITGTGAFAHNGGEVIFLIEDNDTVVTNGSAFNDLRIRQGSGGSSDWYDENWTYRLPLTIRSSEIDGDLTNFPIYVDLSDLPASFFSNINSDGGDIRVTENDGITEVPREIINASTTAQTGELYFEASSVSSTTDSIYYIYYGNSGASDYAVTDPYGAENVWANGYVLVSHMNDETTSTIVNSADGTLDGSKLSANNPAETSNGKIYEAQDFAGTEHIGFGNVGGGASNITISAWFNADNLTGSGDTATYGFSIFSAHSAGNYTWLTAGGTGGGGSTDEIRFCAFSSSATCNVGSGSDLQTGEWNYVSASAIDGGAANVRINGTNVLSFTSNGGGTWNSGSTIGDLRPNRDIEFEGILDEVQISNVVRSTAWQDATYRNQATTTDFYAVGSPQLDSVRTLASTDITVYGNVIIESGTAVFPTGNLSVGGSFTNSGVFDNNSGTVVFSATTSGHTIAVGGLPFYNLTFNGAGGGWNITESATATNAINLVSGGLLTINSGLTLESGGTFNNDLANASTTWTGATLRLSGGTDFALNSKNNEGDDYNVLSVTGDGDVSMWNSSAITYDTQNTASIYSADHNGNNGDLYIFGDYVRESGTEYWSYDTDFDGTDLVASSSERQVDVRIENGATVVASSSGLSIIGSSTASTTIDAQSGSFTLQANTASITASYFEVTGTNASGLQIIGSSTVHSLNNAYFRIPGSSSAITVDASTIDTNPAAQFFDTDFITAGGNVNVTLSGSPTSYWWFRDGAGDRYGEAFDNADGNPGSIRWDDSSYSITVSGTVYADDGSSTMGGPTCDGVTNNVRIVVDGGAYTASTSCSGVNGSYSFSGVNYIGDPNIVVYLDTNGGIPGSVITKTPSGNITDLDIYANRVMTRHEDASPLTIEDMATYDESDDSDIRFVAATGTTNTLTVRADNELYVFASTTFAPGGPTTLTSGGSGNIYDGTLHLGATSTFIGVGTTTFSVGGSIIAEPASTLTTASSTFVMTATTTGKTITASSTLAFNELQFTGVGGGWNLNTDITAVEDITVATGTLTGTNNVTVAYGSFLGDGLVSLGAGTVTINRTNTFGGTQGWTVNNLTLGDGTIVGTTTPGGIATNTISGVLTIGNAHFLDGGSSAWNLTGSGNVLVENGTFLEDTSTVRYSGVLGNNILNTQYYNLIVEASGGTPTYVGPVTGLSILNNLRVGGTAPTTFDLTTNDPTAIVGGDVYVASNGTLVGSNSATLTVSGSWDNDGTFTNSAGTVTFNSVDAFSVAAGSSNFGVVNITGAGAATVIENATSTGAWTLGTSSNFTLSSGQRLAVGGLFTNGAGGSATTWSGSTLHLYGAGQFDINASTTLDEYSTLSAAAGTHIRMWNSSSTIYQTANGGSIYSMDHANVTGELYIFGDYIKSSGTDYWNYSRDFDGTNLGSGRVVDVYVENGGSFTYSGGTLQMIGTTTASTTVQVLGGSGTYSADITGGGINAQYYILQDLDNDGLNLSGSPLVTTLSNGEVIVGNTGATAITVSGSVINANPAKNFVNNRFSTTTGVTTATNVTTSGSTVSSWRFTNHTGEIDGENFDADNGDPGYIVWDDSLAVITISGNVYENDTTTVSSVCDDATTNIVLAVAGVVVPAASSTCSSATGAYSISGVSFSPNDTLTLFINGEADKGTAVSIDPISSVGDMDIYENHVIVRHESTDPILIADMAVYDSSNDTDIPFTAVDAGSDTLTLDSNTKLLVWASKEFEPQGNITTGGGAGNALDGTIELRDNAILTLGNSESHDFGGNLEMGTGSTFTPAQSTVTFTSAGSGRTIDTNENGFYNLILNGAGTFTSNDVQLSINNDITLTNGSLTLPAATTTVTGSLSVTGGSFTANGGLMVFNSAGAETIVTNNSDFNRLQFSGTGSWSMNDTNATTTGDIAIQSGTVTLPSGTLSVGGSFRNVGGIVTHNTSLLVLATNTAATLLASGSDLFGVTFTGGGTFSMEDNSLSLLDDLILNSGSLTLASGTLSVGGSFDATGGTFNHASGTILFNSTDTGETINPGNGNFYHVSFGNASGGWTMVANATTTGNFALTSASNFTQSAGTVLAVGGVFTNNVGGAQTTWTNSTIKLLSGSDYAINTKVSGGDVYGTLYISNNMDIRMWNSSAATTTFASTSISSLYSQDHAATDGTLYVYGTYAIATGTQYWSYANDFDGVALGGGSRAVNVFLVDSASSSATLSAAGTLNIVGASGASTSIEALGSTPYSFDVTGGTLNASYYQLRELDINGLTLNGIPNIISLSNGDFEVIVSGGSAITLASTTLNANPSKLIDNVRFATSTAITAVNINLDATTSNAWTFRDHIGNLSGEDHDVDGVDNCGSIRWDDSSCLLVEQTHYRWRHDDGGEGVQASEWFDTNWDARKRVRIVNTDNVTYATTTVKIPVTYDADMQADFEDLRFTASDGVTELDYWLERYTASADATVWVEVFSLTANDNLDIFMYYDNVTATTTSSSTAIFVAADDFEDNNITEYSGDTGKFQTNATFAFGGSYGLDSVTNSDFTNDGVARFDDTVAQGQIIRYMQYVDTSAGAGDESCALFGVQSPVTNNNNYAVCIELFGVDRLSLVRNAERSDNYGSVALLASTTVSYTTGWYEIDIDWQTDDRIDVSLFNSAGTLVATTSAVDSNYTSGGYGFTYWGQNGGWDDFTSRYRTNSNPSIIFGAEQTDGGASWAQALDTAADNFEIGDVARVRFAVENSGLDITGQQFQLEYAAKGTAPACEAVSTSNFVSVPIQSSCGSSPVCMISSTYFANGANTTDLLFETNGTFTAGKIIEDPSSITSSLDIDQSEYTELEYAVSPTVNATSSSYCLRVTNNGTDLDSYLNVAELGVSFEPTISAWSLNGGADIALTPGTTTTIYATGTVTDLNGYTDFAGATSTAYRSGVTETCADDKNNCYREETPQCTYSACAGNSCTLSCAFDIYYFAEATDNAPYAGETWRSFVEVADQSGATTSAFAPSVDLLTMNAITLDSGANTISYGSLAPQTDTGSYNATTTLENIGNGNIDISVDGTDLSDGGASTIPVSEQKFASTTFDYSACGFCSTLSTTSSAIEVDLFKPTSTSTPVVADVYWGIQIPFGTAAAPHQGTNTFYAVSD